MSASSTRIFRRSFAALALFAACDAMGATVQVWGDNHEPGTDAEVWVNCQLRGSTDGHGALDTPLSAGDHIVVRKAVSTVPSVKGQHDGGWAYRIWHTNVVQNDDGTWSDTIVGAPGVTQSIVIGRKHAIVGFNLVASIEYNATAENLDEIRRGFIDASDFLADVTDGQMVFENVALYDDNRNFAHADAQFLETQWPNANVGGKAGFLNPANHMRFPGAEYVAPRTVANAFRTFVHEFGHYVVGARDEYHENGQATMCTLDRDAVPEASRASIMDNEHEASEFCSDANHNAHTEQGRLNGQSVWATLVANWQGDTLDLSTPMTRGRVDPGPNNMPCMFRTQVQVNDAADAVCPGISVALATGMEPAVGVEATLFHGDRALALGVTDSAGVVKAYGAAIGDRIEFSQIIANGPVYYLYVADSEVVASCGPIKAQLKKYGWVVFHWIPKYNILDRVAEIRVPISGVQADLPAIEVMVRQPGLAQRRVGMKFDTKTRSYVGKMSYDPTYGPSLDIALHATTAGGASIDHVGHFDGALYHANGPGIGAGGAKQSPTSVWGNWNLFASDAPIGLLVDSSSLKPDTSVTVGAIAPPTLPPAGWTYVAGPVSVTGDSPLLTKALLQLRYDVAVLCKNTESCRADPAAFHVLRYNGQGWDVRSMTTDAEHRIASADISEWGIYAVVARIAK